ncbi:hypothetical protein Taro_052441 [Colocasia esculenta]|uniref:WRC domain-containing protein n=1 Tax=Colocasia esculenta TaxID=4460 RepID=A0A843XK84_COLES|nr:hypothetical protein [Colocasia esculenta]
MRIRKRLQSLTSPPDLSSPLPQSMAATAAVPVAATGAAGGKQGEVVAGGGGGGGEKLYGLGSGSGGGGAAGGGGRGLHPNRDLPDQTFHGCTTKPTSPPPSHQLPPDAAAPWGKERSDLAPRGSRFVSGDVPFDDHTRDGEVPKREQEGENGGDGDARRRRNTVVYIGATVAAPKSLGAEAPEPPPGHGGYKALPNGVAAAASAKAEDMAGWGDEAGGFPLKRRRGCCRARGTRSVCGDDDDEEEEEEKMVAEREMKPRAPSNTRRRGVAAASSTTAIATIARSTTAQTSASNYGGVIGAPTGGAAKKSDDVVVKEEGGDVASSAATALVDANRGVGNGKKRRSPAVLMEGSRCSRVNGRGWRCCQQTLVGYSLCEHHLGKGRLRSMSSVRCNGRARKKEDVDNGGAPSQLPSPLQQKQQQQRLSMSGLDEDYCEEEEKPGKRRRKKIGMVKARSISSLLHQPDYSTPTAILAAPEPCPPPSPVPATGAVTACAATPLHDSDSVIT